MTVVDTEAKGRWQTRRRLWPRSSVIDVREKEMEGSDTLHPNERQATKEAGQ